MPPTSLTIERSMLLSKAFYFFYFGAIASLIPFLVLYYEEHGLSGGQIGMLTGIPPMVTLVSAPFWGGAADATQQHKRLLVSSIVFSVLIVTVLSLTTVFWGLILVVVALPFFSSPSLPIVDSAVMDLLQSQKDAYGKQRLWGSIGWGLVAPVIGLLVERSSLQWIFYGYAVFMLGALFVSWRLPVKTASIGAKFWRGLRSLLADLRWFLFLGTILIGGMGLAMITNFLFLYMNDLGASTSLMGLSLTVATLSEMPIFFYSDRLLKRWGAKGLLTFALSAYVLRAFGYSVIQTPWMVLPLQLLHGPVFSAMWVAGVSYANELAPQGMGATAQGLFSGALMGLGASAGSILGGLLYENQGPWMMFRWAGIGVSAGLLFFLIAGVLMERFRRASS